MRNMLIADYLYNFFHFDLMAQYGQSSFLTELFSGHDLFNGSVFNGRKIILPDELEDLNRETDILITDKKTDGRAFSATYVPSGRRTGRQRIPSKFNSQLPYQSAGRRECRNPEKISFRFTANIRDAKM